MFLTTSRGAINLDHVREITWPLSGSDKTVFHFANGETETVNGYHEPLGPVIPAAPGFLLAEADPPYDDEEIDAEAYDFSGCVSLHAIIGWKLESDLSPVPITAHGCRHDHEWGGRLSKAAIVEPSGRVVIPMDQDFSNLAEWTSAVRSTWLLRRQKKTEQQAESKVSLEDVK